MNLLKKAANFGRNVVNQAKSAAAALVGALGLALAGADHPAAAAAVDVTGVTTAINDTLTPIGAIGAAVLLVIVGIKTYKWVRRAM